MKVIDLLNKIANEEEIPKKIRIDHWGYEFEWEEHESNYYDKQEDIDLMSCLSMDKEEFNYEVHELKEDNKIEKLDFDLLQSFEKDDDEYTSMQTLFEKIDEIIDKLNGVSK